MNKYHSAQMVRGQHKRQFSPLTLSWGISHRLAANTLSHLTSPTLKMCISVSSSFWIPVSSPAL